MVPAGTVELPVASVYNHCSFKLFTPARFRAYYLAKCRGANPLDWYPGILPKAINLDSDYFRGGVLPVPEVEEPLLWLPLLRFALRPLRPCDDEPDCVDMVLLPWLLVP